MRRQLAALTFIGGLTALVAHVSAPAGEARAAAVPTDSTDSPKGAELTRPDLGAARLAADVARDALRDRLGRRSARANVLSLPEEALRREVRRDPEALGSLSIGRANRGALFNAVQMPEGPLWHLAEPDKAWGTEETIEALEHAIGRVNEAFVDSPALWIGHISARGGGWLRPHRSHQAGRDVDLGFYYADGSEWYAKGTAKSLDIPRNWVLLSALLRETDVELVFLDRSIQALLSSYALAIGEDAAWLDEVFEGDRRRSQCVVRHEWGHATHMHVRFTSETSRELAERVHPVLVEQSLMPRARYYR